MSGSNNPTAASAVVGERLLLGRRTGRGTALAAALIMPALIAAFATYLVVGIATMDIPPGTAFPGPRFFPALIMSGLYTFAVLLAIQAVREHLRAPAPSAEDAAEPEGVAADTTTLATRRVGMDWASFAWVVGSAIAFALTLSYLGWIVAAGLLFWCVARGFGSRRPIGSLVVGFTVSSATYIAFDMGLGLTLPSGVLGGGF